MVMSHAKALLPLEVPGFGQVPPLSDERCRSILSSASSGYLALSQNALPFVVPVTCVIDGDALVVRTGLGLLGKVPLQPGVVAFETGGASIDGRSRWEVLVQGHCQLTHEGLVLKNPPQLTLVEPALTTVLRIRMELVTGWQYDAALPSPVRTGGKGG
jgi:pyridoxamine 5'-phosphate oxidase-like protein